MEKSKKSLDKMHEICGLNNKIHVKSRNGDLIEFIPELDTVRGKKTFKNTI